MEDKKYQIFISSTYRDLFKARESVIETILGLYHFPVGMEMFSADDDEQWEVIKETINYSDYYILLLGHRYGSETSDGISFTEKEYDYATAQGIPVMAFIRERNVPTTPDERDDDPEKLRKLTDFIQKATTNKMCDFWENEDGLATKVAIALPKAFRRKPRLGWVRADKAMTADVSNEFARLSKENNELRREMEILHSRISNKIPKIDLMLNDGHHPLHFNRSPVQVTRPKLLKYVEAFVKESVEDHLKPYISSDEIKRYNAALPDNTEIDQYNLELIKYFEIKQNARPLEIIVQNIGSTKAHDVVVDIDFPDGLLLVSKEDMQNPPIPENPLPPSLVAKAQKEYDKARQKMSNPLQFAMQSAIRDYPLVEPMTSNLHNILTRLEKKPEPQISQYGNSLHVRLDSLLHTRKAFFDEYCILPIKPGTFDISTSIICEEYDEEKNATFSVEVTEALGESTDNH